MSAPARVLVADDHAPTREDVRAAVEADPRFTVVALAGDAADADPGRAARAAGRRAARHADAGQRRGRRVGDHRPAAGHARGDAHRLAQRRGPVRGAARGRVGLPAQGHAVRGARRRAGRRARGKRRAAARAGRAPRRGVPRQRPAPARAARPERRRPAHEPRVAGARLPAPGARPRARSRAACSSHRPPCAATSRPCCASCACRTARRRSGCSRIRTRGRSAGAACNCDWAGSGVERGALRLFDMRERSYAPPVTCPHRPQTDTRFPTQRQSTLTFRPPATPGASSPPATSTAPRGPGQSPQRSRCGVSATG